jgi:hypothetical protein
MKFMSFPASPDGARYLTVAAGKRARSGGGDAIAIQFKYRAGMK